MKLTDVIMCGCDEPTNIDTSSAQSFLLQMNAKYEIKQSKYSNHSHVIVSSAKGKTEGYNLAVAVKRHLKLFEVDA